MKKDSFVIHKSFYAPVSRLTNEQLGRLFRAIFEYQISGAITEEADIWPFFEFFRNQFDINEAKYEKICEKRSEAIKKRWNKQKNINDTSDTKEYNCIQVIQKNTNDTSITDNDNEKDISISKNNSSSLSLDKKKSRKKNWIELVEEICIRPDFVEMYKDWLKYRSDINKPFKTKQGIEKNYKELLKLSGENPQTARAIIDQSIANEWQGLFELKLNSNGTNNKQRMGAEIRGTDPTNVKTEDYFSSFSD